MPEAQQLYRAITAKLETPTVHADDGQAQNLKEEGKNEERLSIDQSTMTVTLDGIEHVFENPKTFKLYCMLVDAAGNIVQRSEIQKLPGCKGERHDEIFKHIPSGLKVTVKSRTGPGGGRFLQLPPKKRLSKKPHNSA